MPTHGEEMQLLTGHAAGTGATHTACRCHSLLRLPPHSTACSSSGRRLGRQTTLLLVLINTAMPPIESHCTGNFLEPLAKATKTPYHCQPSRADTATQITDTMTCRTALAAGHTPTAANKRAQNKCPVDDPCCMQLGGTSLLHPAVKELPGLQSLLQSAAVSHEDQAHSATGQYSRRHAGLQGMLMSSTGTTINGTAFYSSGQASRHIPASH